MSPDTYYSPAETDLYYLNSRYYDPAVGRFINADGVGLLNYSFANNIQYNMFTYCFNNPVKYFDPTGEFAERVLLFGFACSVIAETMGGVNYVINQVAQKSFAGGFINYQSQFAQFRMGLRGADWNGCGWIAAYNAMLILGRPQQPADVIRYFDNTWGNIALGAFGTNPLYMAGYIVSQGFEQVHNIVPGIMPWNTETVAKQSKACIMLYAHSQGAHYIAFNWNGKNYSAYNANGNSFLSIKEYLKKYGGTFVSIWCIT